MSSNKKQVLYPRYEADATADIDSQVLYPRFEADATAEIDSQYAETQMGVQGAKEDGKGSWRGKSNGKTQRADGTGQGRPCIFARKTAKTKNKGREGPRTKKTKDV